MTTQLRFGVVGEVPATNVVVCNSNRRRRMVKRKRQKRMMFIVQKEGVIYTMIQGRSEEA
jgi:hypothetical protein